VLDQPGPWQEGDLDTAGLPRMHTGADANADPMTAGAGGEIRPIRRQSSGLTTRSEGERRRQSRSRSVYSVLAGGLSAGPTFSKDD